MIRDIIYIILVLILTTACKATKVVNQSKLITAADYPYIKKFHEGICLKITGRTSESIKKFEECLSIRQDDDAVFYILSQLEMSAGNLDKSAEYILKAFKIDTENQWYIQELAHMYYERGEFEESVVFFEDLVKSSPRNIDWQYAYAESLIKIGELNKAIEAFNKAEDQLGVTPSLSIKKYNLLMLSKETKKAIDELDYAREVYPNNPQLIAVYVDHYFKLKEIDKGIEMLKELVLVDPSNGRAHLALADIYRQQGKESESIKELRFVFQSKDVDLDTKMKILIKIYDSNVKINPEVYGLVDLIVKLYPKEAKSHSIQGDYLLRAAKNEEALKAYKRSLKLDKTNYSIWNEVLIIEYQKGDFENLYKDSKECLTLFSTSATVYLLNGISANRLKKYDEAISLLSAGIVFIISDEPLKAEFFAQLGQAYFGDKDLLNGKKYFNKALNLDPKSLIIRNNFAYILANNEEDLDLAESLSLQASNAFPSQSHFIDTYGWVLFQKAQYDRALVQFNKAFKLNGNDKMIVEHLGDVYFKLGRIKEAIEFWIKAKELLSENEFLDKKIVDKKYYDPLY